MLQKLVVFLVMPLLAVSFTVLAAKKKADTVKPEKKSESTKPATDAGQPEEPAGEDSSDPDDGLPNMDDKAPDFTLKDSNGLYHHLSDSKGNVLVLVFFRTDCEPCLLVMQKVVAFYQLYRDEVDVLAIALLEQPNGRARLDEYLEGTRLPFPVLVDKDDRVARDYIMKGNEATLPALFFINEEGVITVRLHRLTMELDSYLDE